MRAIIFATLVATAVAFTGPFLSNCENGLSGVTSGYYVGVGCTSSPIIQPIACAVKPVQGVTCVVKNTLNNTKVDTHDRTVLTSDQHSKLMGVVAAAEGKAFGVTVGAAASYMRTESVSERSVMYVLGTNVIHGFEFVQFDQNLKLTTSALTRLRTDPEGFLKAYGEYYVSGVEKGASFFASININEMASSNSESMSVFTSISTPFGGGSGNYTDAFAKHSSNLSIEARGTRRGGGLIPGVEEVPDGDYKTLFFSKENPSLMETARFNWIKSIKPENVVGLTVTYKPWFNILAVQNVVNAMPANKRALFFPQPVVDQTFQRYDEARILLARALVSVNVAQTWRCLQEGANVGFRNDLLNLNRKLSNELAKIEQLTEVDLRRIQINGELDTYFRGQGIIHEYVDLVQPKMQECDIELTCERCEFGKCDRDGLRCNVWPSGNYHCRVGPWGTACPVGKSCTRYLDYLYYFAPATDATPCVL